MKYLLCVVVVMLGACSNGQPDLKSPCAGAPGSPCERRPANVGMPSVGENTPLMRSATLFA